MVDQAWGPLRVVVCGPVAAQRQQNMLAGVVVKRHGVMAGQQHVGAVGCLRRIAAVMLLIANPDAVHNVQIRPAHQAVELATLGA